jgi:hypothetical protein
MINSRNTASDSTCHSVPALKLSYYLLVNLGSVDFRHNLIPRTCLANQYVLICQNMQLPTLFQCRASLLFRGAMTFHE